MILDTTSKSLEVVLAGTVVANQLVCLASWADITTTTFVPGSNDLTSNNTTAVTLVSAPAASTQRQVKTVNIYNNDTASATVTVQLKNSATARIMVKILLKSGYTLQFSENRWSVLDNTGNQLSATQINAAGGDTQVQFNDGGSALGGSANLTWDNTNGVLKVGGTNANYQLGAVAANPVIPATDVLSIFNRQNAKRNMLNIMGSSGLDMMLQPLLARNKVGYWCPPGNSTTIPGVMGFPAFATVGTLTARPVSTTNLATRMRRLGFVTAATAGALAEGRTGVNQFSCGSGVDDGSGFYFVVRWVPANAAAVAGHRFFIGLFGSVTAATNVEPNTLVNAIGVAQLSTDSTQLYLVYGGSAAQTAIALGAADFPASTLSTVAYELAIYCPFSAANTFNYQVTNISTGVSTAGTLTGTAVQVPSSTTLLNFKAWICNNATALAAGFDICSVYIETDN